MEVKDAVRSAKAYISDLFGDEGIFEIGLEEVDFDDDGAIWNVTIGFRRKWEKRKKAATRGVASMFQDFDYQDRWYKMVRIRDADGHVLSVEDRELRTA